MQTTSAASSGPSLSNVRADLSGLAQFQAAMLEILHAGGTASEMRAKLTAAAANPELSSYVAGFDDRMIVTASELVRKWGRMH